ncbi:nucleotide sugar dehydrogenase [Sphingomonas sp. Root241]|uniref:nucleotide sugar dehydrogenase n=1 Tax=Sphingomonas sp. Root241 TaxID=1736501 RepID=UPI000701FF78|nr:nucleotide sugar dehydrogenase [Sphingomonas sp. Root241]KRC81736.1 UDP-N-acetyl-D-galactosamine dehydrogenase [Sphingomonas sp. Root241]
MKIVVLGLGYVGLPLAVALADKFDTWGLDIDPSRISELQEGHDRTAEIESARLKASPLHITGAEDDCAAADVYIVTVPTPVDQNNVPDLRPILSATRSVAAMLSADRKPIIVYESTVYPGVTEEICGTEIERLTGLRCGEDFFLGYSPERINPGDREHTVDKITKVIAGQTPAVTDKLAEIYGAVTSGGTFRAASIKVAEAAKVIENTQRDVNIALMNEIAQIFAKMDISVWDVLAAAGTKWNFLPFQPGLVGGHCIGVDPYYLSFRAEQLGHNPALILAGRSTNDGMARYVADSVHRAVGETAGSILVLGLTFKENVPDLRNSKVTDLVAGLKAHGHTVVVHDPLADAHHAEEETGLSLSSDALQGKYDAVVLAVPHQQYLELGEEALWDMLRTGGTLCDLKDALRLRTAKPGFSLWSL